MTRWPMMVGKSVCALTALVFLMGVSDCDKEKLCNQSGGTWGVEAGGPGEYYGCEPPSCGETAFKLCTQLVSDKPVCSCPKSAPYWDPTEGCISASECPNGQTCQVAGGSCGALSAEGVVCPAGQSLWGNAGTCPVGGACCIPSQFVPDP